MSSDLTWDQRFGLQRAKTPKIAFFCEKGVYVIAFDSRKPRYSLCQHRISFLRRVEWTIIWPLKVIMKFDLRSRSWLDRKRSCCISVDPYGRPERIYSVLIALAGLYQKLLPKGDLSWSEMTLATWRGVTGRNIPTQDVKSTCNPMFESVSNGFLPKEAPFIFLPLTIIMERSQNWPDLRSPISKFRYICFIDTGTNINHWKFQGNRSVSVALTSVQTFLWGEVTWRDLVTWPWVTWVWNFHKVCGKDVWTAVPKTAKNLKGGGCSNTPPRPGAG